MIDLQVTNQQIKIVKMTPLGDVLVSGTVKEYQCNFKFDETWEGYSKTAVFITEDDSEGVEIQMLDNDSCEIPAQILAKAETYLRIGVYGVKGDYVRPTVFTSPKLIRLGAIPTDEAIEPTPGIYQQIVQIMEDTKKIAQDIRDDVDNGLVGVPVDGTKGQILTKKSNDKFDTEWKDNIHFVAQTVPPEDKTIFWIDTNQN